MAWQSQATAEWHANIDTAGQNFNGTKYRPSCHATSNAGGSFPDLSQKKVSEGYINDDQLAKYWRWTDHSSKVDSRATQRRTST